MRSFEVMNSKLILVLYQEGENSPSTIHNNRDNCSGIRVNMRKINEDSGWFSEMIQMTSIAVEIRLLLEHV